MVWATIMATRRTLASAVLLLAVVELGARADGDGGPLLLRGNFVSVRRHRGERTTAARLGRLWAVETAAAERAQPGDARPVPSFVYREATDGRRSVRAVYDGGSRAVKNCFLSRDDREVALDVMEAVRDSSSVAGRRRPQLLQDADHRPGLRLLGSVGSLLPYLEYSANASDLSAALLPPSQPDGASAADLPAFLLSLLSLDCESPSSAALPSPLGKIRRRRQGLLTYPKTLWCGKGTEAASYDQLGEEASTDACCRDHDTCPYLQIGPLERKLFFRNYSPFTLSDCKCDKAFHRCLKKVGTPVAMGVGNVYFNRLKMKCFVTRKRRQCLETSLMGGCLRRERADTAVVRDARLFPEGKNFTKAEKALRRKRRRELLLIKSSS